MNQRPIQNGYLQFNKINYNNKNIYLDYLRNLLQEIFMQFLSMTYNDAGEWVNRIKQAILISEYEALFDSSNFQISIDQIKPYQNDSSNVTKSIPEYEQKQLQLYQELSKDKWIIEKTLKQMKLSTIQSQNNIFLKGEYVLNTTLENVASIIKKGGIHLNLLKQSSDIHEIDFCQYHQDFLNFNNDGKRYIFESKYIQFDFQSNNSFFQQENPQQKVNFPQLRFLIATQKQVNFHIQNIGNYACC
ncbi:unnamed protein product [Paramecium sonneborni]|uniref:Uncharacterized protein n=1 Tax=Paramecium sonneborni TaxID=65129 RepID=A0A8S1KBL9_9CILI|nr:unnamed protein product [Paramecium sonneborni]CAD8051977.1 unnamed protein product [Paramecium sonneborni]